MTKHQMFVLLVQTQAIVFDIRYNQKLASTVVWSALKMPANVIPDSTADDPDALHTAALDWVNYMYGCFPPPSHRPAWAPGKLPIPCPDPDRNPDANVAK